VLETKNTTGEIKIPLIVKNRTTLPSGVEIATSGIHIIGKGILINPPG
jgi:primase-polymerase (primpol)-like protein